MNSHSDTKARLLGLIGLGSIAVWLTISQGNSFYLALISLRWPKVPVQITSTGVDTGVSTIGKWWAPEVDYEYQLSGRAYHSGTIRYLMRPYFDKEQAETILAAYPTDRQTMAAYDPQDPARSVLEPGVPPSMWPRALIPIFFWALTGYIYYEINHPDRRLLLQSRTEILAPE